MNLVRTILVAGFLALALPTTAGAQTPVLSQHAVVSVRLASRSRDTTTTTSATSTSTSEAPTTTSDDDGFTLRGPWTAVSTVVAVTLLLVFARRRLRARERSA